MHQSSLKLFARAVFKRAYWGFAFMFLDVFGIYERFLKPSLPKEYQRDIDMPIGLMLSMLIVLWAAYKAYHDLRMARLDELYAHLPEANRDRAFRIFYNLLKVGELVKGTSKERRQQWDDCVLKEIGNYCSNEFKSIYLQDTGRRYGEITPIQDDKFGIAIEHIQRLIDRDFDWFIRA